MTTAIQDRPPQATTKLPLGSVADAGASAGAEASQFLTFMLAGEPFAIGILAIREIIEYHGLTPVPRMPACVRGVINLRGAVVPVIDLQARLGHAPGQITRRSCIVIVEIAAGDSRQVVGVVVDAVNEVLDIAPADIEPAPSFGARMRTDFIAGMGKVRGRFVIVLDVERVLTLDDLLSTGPADGADDMPADNPKH